MKQFDYINPSNWIAKTLLNIGAVKINSDRPFRLTSGKLSPIYIDVRLLISYPEIRHKFICEFTRIAACLNSVGHAESSSFDVVAGCDSAGIPFAAWIADRLNKPLIYVRKSPKQYGKKQQIEGILKTGQNALLIDDLLSYGTAKHNFITALREAGAKEISLLVVLDYNLPNVARELANLGVRVYSLTNLSMLLDIAEDLSIYSPQDTQPVREFLDRNNHV